LLDEFYSRLFTAALEVESLFPDDLKRPEGDAARCGRYPPRIASPREPDRGDLTRGRPVETMERMPDRPARVDIERT
jgi:hypothetical protein